jgi:hypothetical protein
MESNDGRNPDIPASAYELVGGPQGKLEMGHFSWNLLYFKTHGRWPPTPSERPRWRLRAFESPVRQ